MTTNEQDHIITRGEFKSEITRVEAVLGIQIGAVEKSVKERLSSMKAWGIAALVGGQAAAGVLAAIVPHKVADTAMHILHYL
jgi:hypothetical protein